MPHINNIEKARLEAGLTRVALAKQIGMAPKSLQNLEMGFRKFDAYELYTLSRILKKPMYYLLNKPRLGVEDIKVES